MANLVNPNNQNKKAFSASVDNSTKTPTVSGGAKFVWYLSFLLIIPAIMHIAMKNSFMKEQMSINETASGIDVQLKKRRDTLVKLVDATKSYVKYEKSTLTELTKLRKSTFKTTGSQEKLDSIARQILAVAENYPDLKANELASKTMEAATYIESEIAAARRLYNRSVTMFNQRLFTWPSNIVASGMKLETIKLFKTSVEDKKDVELKF